MGLAVAVVSFAVGGTGVARFAFPAFDQWAQGKEFAFGGAVVPTVALAFVAAPILSRAWHATVSARDTRCLSRGPGLPE